jgi:hypothetical protein
MRFIVPLLLAAWCIPSVTLAQAEKRLPPEIKKIHVGFQTYHKEEQTAYKVGLWTPVYVELFGGSEGIAARPGEDPPHIEIETVDSEDVGTLIRVPVKLEPLESQTVMGYVKTGRLGGGSNEVTVTLRANKQKYKPLSVDIFYALDIDAHLYLTIGPKITDLYSAVRKIDKQVDDKEILDPRVDFQNSFRHVVYENKVERLPEVWFGYNSVDMIVLATGNREFLKVLNQDAKKFGRLGRAGALAQWVRRGGRLVVPIAHANQDVVAELLKSQAWVPPIPVVPPSSAGKAPLALRSLPKVAQWGGVQDKPFQRADPKQKLELAKLDDGNVPPGNWQVLAESDDDSGKHPLIAQVRYGLGQITYMAFSLEDTSFFQWDGKEQFLQTMVFKLAPKAPGGNLDKDGRLLPMGRQNNPNDITTDLLGILDNFDVKVIPFGYVALFIVLYILVVGPLDFVLLKYVFKRLEWTWITFPVVVLAVSVIAYFAAYALKGRDLKINKIDIVDFDMRTSPDAENVHAYGHSFFTILSPRIQNYTIGVEPNPLFWGAEVEKKVMSVDLLSWMGRPSGGPHGMGRSGSAGFFRKPYAFRDDAKGLEGVPIPVWTTKAFCASWEQTLKAPPFVVDLVYQKKQIRGKDLKITGKLENHLAVDLIDVWLIYDDRCYPITDGLKSVKNGAAAQPISLPASTMNMDAWANLSDPAPEPRAWSSDPTSLVKRILFHERVDTQNIGRNHLLRPLDLGWRIQEERHDQSSARRTREAILFARVRHASGPAETVTKDAQLPLPTKLWLGDIPDAERSRPDLIGQLNQDTYIRVILPVRPAEE